MVGVISIFMLCCLAERMRTPFDFVEGERELVSGFNTEYRGIIFVLIFLGEYAALIFLGILSVMMWLGCSY
jgi:NADH:ubiquinone oxidoreductase subunit H